MKWLKEELEFNRKELLGISVLMSIGMIALIFQYMPTGTEKIYDITIDDILIADEEIVETKKSYNQYKQFPKKKQNSESKREWRPKEEKSANETFERFAFDPNTVSKDSLIRLGFKKRVAETWVKFRSKGKKYKSKEDLLSIYGIDSSLVSRLNNFLIFPRKEKKSKVYAKSNQEYEKEFEAKIYQIPAKKIDLNSCTEEDLKALGGIGSIFASRILKYRDLLGGYVRKDQLKEVYGLTDSTFQVIQNFVEISSPPELLQINTASKKQLSDHYFIDYKAAKLIYAYRAEHGPFIDKQDFQSLKGIPEHKKNEILPYLSFAL